MHTRLSRSGFLRLAGAGVGLAFSGSLGAFAARTSGAEVPFAGGEFPVGLWWPPPPEQTSPERYAEIRAAGFDFVIGGNGVAGNSTIPAALEAAAANGLEFIAFDARLQRAFSGGANNFRSTEVPASPMRLLVEQESGGESGSYEQPSLTSGASDGVNQRVRELVGLYAGSPAFAGIDLFDEPEAGMFGTLRSAREVLEGLDTALVPYVNVWPSYASPEALGTSSYGEYLTRYLEEVGPPILSFDHYPLLAGGGLTSDYFLNWAKVRHSSLKYGVPSWVFIQSLGFDGSAVGLAPRRRPNLGELLWQVNVSLAYGAKGIQYFTYWTPDSGSGPVNFGEALVSRTGDRTSLYDAAKNVNSYLKSVGRVLLPLVSESVVHAREGRLPRGTAAFRPDAYVKSVRGSPVILGRFRMPGDQSRRYYLAVNGSGSRGSGATLTTTSGVRAVERFDPASSGFVAVPKQLSGPRKLGLKLAPGEAQLFVLWR